MEFEGKLTAAEIERRTGISHDTFIRLKHMGVVPYPEIKGRGKSKGVIGLYPPEVESIVKWVIREQNKGRLSLVEAALKYREEKQIDRGKIREIMNNLGPKEEVASLAPNSGKIAELRQKQLAQIKDITPADEILAKIQSNDVKGYVDAYAEVAEEVHNHARVEYPNYWITYIGVETIKKGNKKFLKVARVNGKPKAKEQT